MMRCFQIAERECAGEWYSELFIDAQEFGLLNYSNVIDKVLFSLLVTSRELFLSHRERPSSSTLAVLKSIASIAVQMRSRIDDVVSERASGRQVRVQTDLKWSKALAAKLAVLHVRAGGDADEVRLLLERMQGEGERVDVGVLGEIVDYFAREEFGGEGFERCMQVLRVVGENGKAVGELAKRVERGLKGMIANQRVTLKSFVSASV